LKYPLLRIIHKPNTHLFSISLVEFISMMAGLLDVFIGSTQSRWAAVALLVAVVAAGLYILVGKSKLSFSEKVVGIVVGVLLLLPYVLLNLFQLTCLVTGTGRGGEKWWCGVFAWIISAFVILYAAFLTVAIVVAILTDGKVNALEQFYVEQDAANKVAKQMVAEKEGEKKEEPAMEKFFEEASAPAQEVAQQAASDVLATPKSAGAVPSVDAATPEAVPTTETFANCASY
jgi:hypothetical protein